MRSKRCWSNAFPPSALDDAVTEADEVYINAGEKGRRHLAPTDPPRRRANKQRGHGTWDTDRLPVAGVVGRSSGQVRLRVLEHSSGAELRSLGAAASAPGSVFNTDEWRGYNWVTASGRAHKTVCHAPGVREWARDDDGAGVREVHVNTIEGLWTGLRNFVRPLRGISKQYLSQYLAVFEWAHNLKKAIPELLGMMIRPFTFKPT
jgi:transposase-like protein